MNSIQVNVAVSRDVLPSSSRRAFSTSHAPPHEIVRALKPPWTPSFSSLRESSRYILTRRISCLNDDRTLTSAFFREVRERKEKQNARSQVKRGAQIVASVSNVDDLVERFPSTVPRHERLQLFTCVSTKRATMNLSAAPRTTRSKALTFAHVGRTADFALVLLAVGVDAAPQLQESVVAELCGVRDDLVELVLHAVVLSSQDR